MIKNKVDRKLSTTFAMIVILLIGLIPAWLIIFNFGQADAWNYESGTVKSELKPKISTSAWKTYRNENYNYTLKYPADWKILTLGLAPAETFSAPFFQSPECGNEDSPICIDLMVGHIYEVNPGDTLEADLPLGAGTDYILNQKQNMQIGGEKALLVEFFQKSYGRGNGELGKVRQQIKVFHQGINYIISIDQENDNIKKLDSSRYWKKQEVIQAMLDSFQFIK